MTSCSNRISVVRRLVLLVLLVSTTMAAAGTSGDPARGRITRVGALLSLTGEWSSLGNSSKAALEIAVADINRELQVASSPDSIRLLVEDTRLVPAVALSKLRRLAAQGVRTVIGPQSSAEVARLKQFAQWHGIL